MLSQIMEAEVVRQTTHLLQDFSAADMRLRAASLKYAHMTTITSSLTNFQTSLRCRKLSSTLCSLLSVF